MWPVIVGLGLGLGAVVYTLKGDARNTSPSPTPPISPQMPPNPYQPVPQPAPQGQMIIGPITQVSTPAAPDNSAQSQLEQPDQTPDTSA
jgi:hypothetical protein